MNILGIVIVLIYILFILFFSSIFSKYSIELSRKFAHIMCANSWIISNFFFDNIYYCIIPPFIITIIMILSYKYNIFKGVERPNQKKSYGTVYFFLAMIILEIISFVKYQSIITLGGYFLILGYGDAFAALIGKKKNWIPYKVGNYYKSISGNVAMFIFSFFSFYLYMIFYNLEYSIMDVFIISIIATFLEAISVKGTDNLTIPIGTYFIFELIRGIL